MKIISYLCTCKTERKYIMDYMTNAKIKEAICKVFPSEAEAYKDMRQAALMKMCWNTEYDNDFDDGDTVIGY